MCNELLFLVETSALHIFFMISNLFVILVFGLRCLDITNNVTRLSHQTYRNKQKRVLYEDMDGSDDGNF
jgi:hypothetical protein